MLPGGGTILFTGASASLRGRANFAAFNSAKAGLRTFAQAMAKEYGPEGIHVGHVVVDGPIAGENRCFWGRFGLSYPSGVPARVQLEGLC